MGQRSLVFTVLGVIISAYVAVPRASGQVEVVLEPDHLMGSDTVWVDVRMKTDRDISQESVWAFQFRVATDSRILFLGSSSAFTLTAIQGWSTDDNPQNGLVGGFSSRSDGINPSGVLIRLQFLLSRTDTPGKIELQDFRLNMGIPDHFPAVPSLRLDFVEHPE